MIWNFIAWCCFGLIAGAIARFLYPGPDRLGCFGTILLGIAGSIFGGFLGHLIFGAGDTVRPAGWIGSIIGGVLVLAILRRVAPRPPI